MAIDTTIEDWIKTLPDTNDDITIKVYNSFYVAYLREKIARAKGFDYLQQVSFIIPGDDNLEDLSLSWDKKVYLSPILHDYIGNGYN